MKGTTKMNLFAALTPAENSRGRKDRSHFKSDHDYDYYYHHKY